MRPKFDPEEEFITLYYLQYKKSDGARHLIQDAIILIIGIVFESNYNGIFIDKPCNLINMRVRIITSNAF